MAKASKFECERCGQTFASKTELQEHAKTCSAQTEQVKGAGGHSRH
jgi:hypothetical protein